MSLTVTATESTAVTAVLSAARVSALASTPMASSATSASGVPLDSGVDPASCTLPAKRRSGPLLRMGQFFAVAVHRGVFALKFPDGQVAHAQRPGIDAERRIHAARARQDAAINHIQTAHPVYTAPGIDHGIRGVPPADQRATSVRCATQSNSTGQAQEPRAHERALERAREGPMLARGMGETGLVVIQDRRTRALWILRDAVTAVGAVLRLQKESVRAPADLAA